MIKLIILSTMLNTGDIIAMPPEKPKTEARKRGKQHRGRKRGGNGLR